MPLVMFLGVTMDGSRPYLTSTHASGVTVA